MVICLSARGKSDDPFLPITISGDVQVSTGVKKLMFRLSGYIITNLK